MSVCSTNRPSDTKQQFITFNRLWSPYHLLIIISYFATAAYDMITVLYQRWHRRWRCGAGGQHSTRGCGRCIAATVGTLSLQSGTYTVAEIQKVCETRPLPSDAVPSTETIHLIVSWTYFLVSYRLTGLWNSFRWSFTKFTMLLLKLICLFLFHYRYLISYTFLM